MGYTHYWKNSRDFTDEEWAGLVRFAPKLFDAVAGCNIKIQRDYENAEPPHVDDFTPGRPNALGHYIAFNGAGDEGHETLVISKQATDFNCCKTARKPYDAVVVAILCWAHQVCPTFTWSSDGDDEPDYKDEGEALLALVVGQ